MRSDRRVYVLDAHVAHLDLTIVRIDVDRFARELSMHDIVLVQELKGLKYLLAPLFDHIQAQSLNLLQIPGDTVWMLDAIK